MSMENDLRAVMLADATISGLVGTRVFPGTYAQGATDPCVRYLKVAGAPGLHMQGSDGLSSSLVQIDARALTAQSAMDVREAIVDRLHGFRGVKGNTDFRLVALRDDRGIAFEAGEPDSYYVASLDFDVWSRAF